MGEIISSKVIPKVGDLILLKVPTAVYTSYNVWAEYHNLTMWDKENIPKADDKYKIICFSSGMYAEKEKEYQENKRMGIESITNGKQYIFVRDMDKYGGSFEILSRQLEFDF